MNAVSSLQSLVAVIAEDPWLARLMWASLEVTVLAGIVVLLERLFRRMPARLRALLWLVVIVKAVFALCC